MKPSQAQIKAGNYPKKHVHVGGLDISIENRKGSIRSGTGKDGRPWSVKMPCDYGYVRGTLGRDGDQLDVFLGPERNLTDESPVWVMNQKKPDGIGFDEHKFLVGFRHVGEAWQTYQRAYNIPMLGRLSGMNLGRLKCEMGNAKRGIKREIVFSRRLTPRVLNMGSLKEFYYEGDFRRQREIERTHEERGKLIRTGILAAGVIAGGAAAGKILKPVVAREAHRDAVRTAVNKVVAAQRNARIAGVAKTEALTKAAQQVAAADKKARKGWLASRKPVLTRREAQIAKKSVGLSRVLSPKFFDSRDLRDYAVAGGATAAGAGIAYAGWRAGAAAKAGEAAAVSAGKAAEEARRGVRSVRKATAGAYVKGKKIDRVLRGAKTQLTTFPTFSKWARAARNVKLEMRNAKWKELEQKRDTLAHDVAVGGIEGGAGVLATDRLIQRFAPHGSGVGRKLIIGAGVGALATGVIGAGISRFGNRKSKIQNLKSFSADEAGIPFTGKVAKDRYIKKLRDEDLDRRDANVLRAGAAGAVAGALAPHKILIGKRALIGAGLATAGVLGVRAATSHARDPYGERPRGAKRAEGLPALAAVGASGVLAAKRLRIFSFRIPHSTFHIFAKGERKLNSSVKAGLSAAASGAALGLIPAFRRGVGLKTVLKSVAGGAGIGAAVGGGGTFVGTKILGDPGKREGAPITKRAAVGGAAVGAGAGLLAGVLAHKTRGGRRLLVKASKAWRPARWARKSGVIGAATIGSATGAVVGGMHAADEGQQVDTLNAMKKKAFRNEEFGMRNLECRPRSARLLSSSISNSTFLIPHFLGYYNQPREDWSYAKPDGGIGKGRFHARFANPVREAFGVGAPKLMPNPDGSPSVISQAQSLRGFYNEGKKVHKWGGRAARLVGDTGSVLAGSPRRRDASGRPVKREWEKSWFKNAVGSAATAGAIAGGAVVATKTPFGRNTVQPALKRALKKAEDHGFRLLNAELGMRNLECRPRSARLLSASISNSKFKIPHYFDEWANLNGWDVRDPRGKSARVFAPGSRQRYRREADWHETKEGQRKIWQTLALAGTAAGLGAGLYAGKTWGRKTAFKARAVKARQTAKLNKVELRPLKPN